MEIAADICARAGLQPPQRHRAPRHQAGERHDHPRRARSRSWTSASPARSPTRRHDDPDRRRDRHRPVPLAGAGPRRGRRRPLRRLLDRLPALRAAHRRAAVHRRLPGRGGLPARAGGPAARRRRSTRGVPPELDAIVLKAMGKNPANRYQSAAEMRSDLLRALAGQPVEATPVMGDAEKTTILAAPPGGYDYGEEDWDDEDDARRRKRRIIAIVAAVARRAAHRRRRRGRAAQPRPRAARRPQVAVPGILNQDQAAAEAALKAAGLEVGTVTQAPSDADQVGKVIQTDPTGGTRVDEGTTVNLTVGTGPDAITVPNVVGLTQDEARREPGERRLHRQHQHAPGLLPRGRGPGRRGHAGAELARRRRTGDRAEPLARHHQAARRPGQDRGRGAAAR